MEGSRFLGDRTPQSAEVSNGANSFLVELSPLSALELAHFLLCLQDGFLCNTACSLACMQCMANVSPLYEDLYACISIQQPCLSYHCVCDDTTERSAAQHNKAQNGGHGCVSCILLCFLSVPLPGPVTTQSPFTTA